MTQDNTESKKLLVVYHSQSGRNERLAYAAAAAATEEGVQIRLLRAMEASCKDLIWCDGVLLCTPENFGALSGGIKDFLDRCFYPAIDRNLVRPYALMVCSGNDGSNAVRQLEKIAKGMGLKPVAEPYVCHGRPNDAHLAAARELGQALAAGLELGVF
ncbi:NAD(P)H-dependent oxidoreductase [Spongiibacter sp. KMU-166]|uniref:NAD(P)H-dependent oxidoreductase n=1 Tax=Spongiibacter thalassae TaxID=2721624 RepID=A0ABX1GF23_9GAMM|nr:NAD(P)H-dependent oxidoreductase [Spongiibacter thalassae]NKI16977.1 NAD(P)H-dependent oxidoreductase [Spongiibacter thalassae]